MHGKIGQIHHEGLVVARRVEPDLVPSVGGDGGDGVQVHRARQHAAVLMVGVVAHDLGAARRGDEHLRFAAEVGAEIVGQRSVARQLILTGVERAQALGIAFKNLLYIHGEIPSGHILLFLL